jgi:hypothetical protein
MPACLRALPESTAAGPAGSTPWPAQHRLIPACVPYHGRHTRTAPCSARLLTCMDAHTLQSGQLGRGQPVQLQGL